MHISHLVGIKKWKKKVLGLSKNLSGKEKNINKNRHKDGINHKLIKKGTKFERFETTLTFFFKYHTP